MERIKYLNYKKSWDCHLHFDDDDIKPCLLKSMIDVIKKEQRLTDMVKLRKEHMKAKIDGLIPDFVSMITTIIVQDWSKTQLVIRRDIALIKHEDHDHDCSSIMKMSLVKLKKEVLSGTPVWFKDGAMKHETPDGNSYIPVYSRHAVDRIFSRLYPHIKCWHQAAYEVAFNEEQVQFTKDTHFRKIMASNVEMDKMLFLFIPYSIEDDYIIYTTLLVDGMQGTPHDMHEYVPDDVAFNNNKYLELIAKGFSDETWDEFKEL